MSHHSRNSATICNSCVKKRGKLPTWKYDLTILGQMWCTITATPTQAWDGRSILSTDLVVWLALAIQLSQDMACRLLLFSYPSATGFRDWWRPLRHSAKNRWPFKNPFLTWDHNDVLASHDILHLLCNVCCFYDKTHKFFYIRTWFLLFNSVVQKKNT